MKYLNIWEWLRQPPWSRKTAHKIAGVLSIFVLFVLGVLSDRSHFMEERSPDQVEEDHVTTDADGKRTYVHVIPSDPALRESLEELAAMTRHMGKMIARMEVFLSAIAFTFLGVYFRSARMALGASREAMRQDTELPQSAVSRPWPGRSVEATLVAVGFAGLTMALAVVVLLGVIVWLDWRGGLESVAGRAQSVKLSVAAAKTALGAGICSLVFLCVTEWGCRQRIKPENSDTPGTPVNP